MIHSTIVIELRLMSDRETDGQTDRRAVAHTALAVKKLRSDGQMNGQTGEGTHGVDGNLNTLWWIVSQYISCLCHVHTVHSVLSKVLNRCLRCVLWQYWRISCAVVQLKSLSCRQVSLNVSYSVGLAVIWSSVMQVHWSVETLSLAVT